jgi:hypothetical protein
MADHELQSGSRCASECPLAVTLETSQNVYNHEVTASTAEGHELLLGVNTALLRDAGGTPLGGVVSCRNRRWSRTVQGG